MKVTFYGFDLSTHRCIWTADGPVQEMSGCVIIESPESYGINDIELCEDDGVYSIGVRVITAEEIAAKAEQLRQSHLRVAADKIAVLTDVVEYTPSEGATTELAAWRKYRAEMYTLVISDATNIEWPKSPGEQ